MHFSLAWLPLTYSIPKMSIQIQRRSKQSAFTAPFWQCRGGATRSHVCPLMAGGWTKLLDNLQLKSKFCVELFTDWVALYTSYIDKLAFPVTQNRSMKKEFWQAAIVSTHSLLFLPLSPLLRSLSVLSAFFGTNAIEVKEMNSFGGEEKSLFPVLSLGTPLPTLNFKLKIFFLSILYFNR